MSITQKLEKNYKNQIELIKNEKNWKTRIRLIGALCLDIGGRCIKAVAKAIGSCRKYVKKCYFIIKNNLIIISNKNNSGRKKKTEEYPELINDIKNIIENNTYTDPRFGTEIQFCSLTIDEVMTKLMSLNKYPNKFISRSALATLLNELGFNFKKVKRNKPLKKIAETDLIFENVKNKKEEAFKEETAALISIDTKDKVLIGPYSRRRKSRVTIEACDHELTNRCLIPFGILDLKTNQSYFYNFNNKPTSLAIVDCIEDYIKKNTKYNKINILLDNGPDNSGVRTAFIKGLADIANKYQKKIELIYYPPYHSKYNPVERLWARLEKMWNGMLLVSEDICNKVMEKLTWNNVWAKVKYITKNYDKGIKYSKEEMKQYDSNIIRNNTLKKWSIIFTPSAL